MKSVGFTITLVLATLLATVPVFGSDCEALINNAKKTVNGTPDRDRFVHDWVLLGNNLTCWTDAISRATGKNFASGSIPYAKLLQTLEKDPTNKQAGSSTGTGGTTNLISKGLTAQVLSVAMEYGALTESTSNQVVTVQGTLDGIPNALIRQSLVQYCAGLPAKTVWCVRQGLLSQLRRLSYGVSFNTNQNSQPISGTPNGSQSSTTQSSTTQPVTFAASGHEITAITGKYVVINRRDVKSKDYQTCWQSALNGTANQSNCSQSTLPSPTDLTSAATKAQAAAISVLPDPNNAIYTDWMNRATAALRAATPSDLDQTWWECGEQLVDLLQAPTAATKHVCGAPPSFPTDQPTLSKKENITTGLPGKASAYLQALSDFLFEEQDFVQAIANKPVLTVEYDNNRPTGQISYSIGQLIYGQGIGTKWSLTGNAAVAVYDSHPPSSVPGASRLRDIQAGLEADYKLSVPAAIKNLGIPTLSGPFYFQHQSSPVIVNVNASEPLTGITFSGLSSNASQVFAQKGNISVGQLKVSLGTGSVRVPLSISYSNRTELITRPTWKAQIGISYNFDSLFASSGSAKTNQ